MRLLKLTLVLALASCGYDDVRSFSEDRPLRSPLDSGHEENRGEVGENEFLTYETLNNELFIPHCIRCHNSQRPRGGISLETYQEIVLNISIVQEAIISDFMPLNAPALPMDVKMLLVDWIDAGTPEL